MEYLLLNLLKDQNVIGYSTGKLLAIENNKIHIEMVDILHGTLLIDIKSFYSKYDNRINTKSGWFDN